MSSWANGFEARMKAACVNATFSAFASNWFDAALSFFLEPEPKSSHVAAEIFWIVLLSGKKGFLLLLRVYYYEKSLFRVWERMCAYW